MTSGAAFSFHCVILCLIFNTFRFSCDPQRGTGGRAGLSRSVSLQVALYSFTVTNMNQYLLFCRLFKLEPGGLCGSSKQNQDPEVLIGSCGSLFSSPSAQRE